MTRSWMNAGVRLEAVLMFAMLGTVAGAQSYLPIQGGPGGGSFEEQCGSGQNLLGFELRTGDDVDAPVLSTVRTPIPICDSARSARGRNSPAAPELERQCRTLGGDP